MNTLENSTSQEKDKRKEFFGLIEHFVAGGMPSHEFGRNLGLFISRQNMSRILFMHELYTKILDVHGVVMEFGVRWGQNLAMFECFRGIYEPFNHNRKIVGFDTFEGFASLDEKDGSGPIIKTGSYNVSPGYEKILERILDYHENESPIAHIKKYELVKGDAVRTVPQYFKDNPHTLVALAYFDFDIYRPTYESLKIIKDYVTKGSVIAFDEVNCQAFPGETLALKEIFGLDKYAIKRTRYESVASYLVIK